MLKKSFKAGLVALLIFPAAAVVAEENGVVAIVNGQPIGEGTLGLYVQKRLGVPMFEGLPADKKEEILEELINRELVYQDALARELDKDPEIALQIEEVVKNTLLRVRLNKVLEDNPPKRDELMKVYQKQIVEPSTTEYRARHILLREEQDAKNVIQELNKGTAFDKLAKEHSEGPSKEQGGDLGWFALNQMVKPFSDAVAKLKPREFTQRPVQTRFGWHVILLEETRKVEPPPYESVQAQVLEIVQNRIIGEYIDKLRDNATIEFGQ